MAEPTLNIRGYFATPVIRGEFPDIDDLNRTLVDLFLEKEAEGDKYRNQSPFNTTRGAVFDSNFDLFQWPDPPVKDLAQRMHRAVAGAVMQLNGYRENEVQRLKFNYHAWFHITRKGGSKTLHNHPNASWSMVYYVDAGDPSDEEERSGYMQLYDPRHGANMYQDYGNMKMGRAYSFNGVTIPPKSGHFLIFPSYIHHEVLPYWGSRPRVMVAANAWVS